MVLFLLILHGILGVTGLKSESGLDEVEHYLVAMKIASEISNNGEGTVEIKESVGYMDIFTRVRYRTAGKGTSEYYELIEKGGTTQTTCTRKSD